MWGVIPAAGVAARLQPLMGSKELVPVGRGGVRGGVRPVGDYILERLRLGGAARACLVTSPVKPDLLAHYRDGAEGVAIAYVVQPQPRGLCDALFRARLVVPPTEDVLIGLPDTIWFPKDAFARIPKGDVSLLCFPVADGGAFDAVETAADGATVTHVHVKAAGLRDALVWGGLRCSGAAFAALERVWRSRGANDAYLGGVLNSYMAEGGRVRAVVASGPYFDVGTPAGLEAARAAMTRGGLGV